MRMIDTLIQILDRLIQLLRVRGKRRARRFQELWEPTFRELRDVHGDYLAMFQACKQNLVRIKNNESDGVPVRGLEEIASELRRRRLEFEPVRRQLIALINHTQNLELDDGAHEFLNAILWYFPTGANRSVPTWATETIARLEALLMSVENVEGAKSLLRPSIDSTLDYVSDTMRHQRRAWDRVAAAYAVLQAQSADSVT
jgi:hypothetical protein